MQHLALAALTLSVGASANPLFRRQGQAQGQAPGPQSYYSGVCLPMLANGTLDLAAPCNDVQAIVAECMYGANGLALVEGAPSASENPRELGNVTQRDCLCESQFFTLVQGCEDCYSAHGLHRAGLANQLGAPAQVFSSLSTTYCAASVTPTLDLLNFVVSFQSAVETGTAFSSLLAAASAAATHPVSDPLGNNTAVSLYWTPSVTGTAAWLVAQATESVGGSTSVSLNTVSGQIVPTAVSAAAGASSASGSASASATGKGGAGKPEAVAAAGIIALAGVVAML